MELEYIFILSIFGASFIIPILMYGWKNRAEIWKSLKEVLALFDRKRIADFFLHVGLILCACTPWAIAHRDRALMKHHHRSTSTAAKVKAMRRDEDGDTSKKKVVPFNADSGADPLPEEEKTKDELAHQASKEKKKLARHAEKERKAALQEAAEKRLKKVKKKGEPRKKADKHWSEGLD
jgi:hypothetical protein